MTNTKKTSAAVASQAAKILKDPNASAIEKSLAGSALSQTSTSNQTGAHMEDIASQSWQALNIAKKPKPWQARYSLKQIRNAKKG